MQTEKGDLIKYSRITAEEQCDVTVMMYNWSFFYILFLSFNFLNLEAECKT